MIKVACLSCSAPYDLDERRLPATGLRMRCPKCGTSFQVMPDGTVAPAAAQKQTVMGTGPTAPTPAAKPGPAASATTQPDDLDLPAPRAPKPPIGGAPVVPRPPGAPAASAAATPASPARRPIAMGPTPVAPPARAPLAPAFPGPAASAASPPSPGAAASAFASPRGAAPAKPADPLDLDLDLPAPRSAARPVPAPAARVPAPAPAAAAPAAPSPSHDDLELDLPAPRAPGRPLAPGAPAARPKIAPPMTAPAPAAPMPDDELDLPSPRIAGPKPAHASPKIAPPPSRNTPVELDLPAPRAAKPGPFERPLAAAAAPAPTAHRARPDELDLGLDGLGGADLELDLPAPRDSPAAPAPRGSASRPQDPTPRLGSPRAPAAQAAPSATSSARGAALADTSRTPFDDDFDLDLPAPGGDVDLPTSKGRAGGLDLDLPTPRGKQPEPDAARPAVLAAADHAFGDLDLPMPRGGGRGGEADFGDLDLPAPRSGGDADLPTPRAVDLPMPRSGADLPAPRGVVDLPASFGNIDLPSPRSAELPGLRGGSADLPPLGGIDLSSRPPPARGRDEADFGDLELPLPQGSGSGAGPVDDLELPLPPGAGAHAGGHAARAGVGGAGRGHGEIDLGGGDDFDGGQDAFGGGGGGGGGFGGGGGGFGGGAGDDMEFADIPQQAPAERAASARTAPRADRGTADRGTAARGPAPASAPRGSRAPYLVVGLIAVIAIAGGALAFTPYGPFGIYAAEQYMPGAGDPARVRAVIEEADRRALADVRAESWQALRDLASARHDAGLHRGLLARSLLHEALYQIRFGGDPGSTSRAAAIRERLTQRATDDPAIALGLAADELRSGDAPGAAANMRRARTHAPNDPFVDLVDGEIALAEDRPADAAQSFTAALEHAGGAAAQWGIARALLRGEDAAAIDAAIEATLAASPRHAGARVAKANRLWSHRSEQDAVALAREVTGEVPVDGEPLRASAADRADAFVLLGRVHEDRGRIHQARQAYAAASELDARRVEALLGAGRTLLADRPSDALARFESVLGLSEGTDVVVASGRTARDEARLGAARAKIALDRVEEARTELEALARERAEDAEVMLWLGHVEERLDHTESAEQHFREAVRLAPTMFDAYLALAQHYAERDRAGDAVAVLEQARSQVEESARMRQALGGFELARNRLPEAVRELRRALELDPQLPAASFGLGVALRRSGDLAEASRVFEQLAAIDPGHPGLALERGLLYEARGEADRAVQFYTAALREHPDDPDLMLRLGGAQVAAGEIDAASSTLEQVQRMLPSSAEAEHYLGRVAFARGQLPEASSHFERAVSLDATRGEFFLYAAWAQIELGNIGRALERAETAIARDPSLGDAYWIRGRVHLRAGAVRDALADLQRALELRPERIEAHADMGDCYDQLRQLPQAIQAYQRAIAARDTQGEWWYRLGRLQLDAGQRADSARALARATLLGEASTPQPHWLADAHRLQGEAMRLGGERAGAVEHFRRYLEIAPVGAIDRSEVRRMLMDLGAVPPGQ
jgi:predicted Zn finger-like uncharacterized protein